MQKLPPVAERFIEDFGLSLASQGFSRTAGRLLGLILMLDDGGDLESLAAHLRGFSRGAGAAVNATTASCP